MSEQVWIVDDDQSIRFVLQHALQQQGISCSCFVRAEDVVTSFNASERPEVIITDVKMERMTGFELLEHVITDSPTIPVIVMTAHSDLDSAVNAYGKGAFEYLPKPFDMEYAVTVTQRALEHARTNRQQKQDMVAPNTTGIIGAAPAMQEVFRIIGRLSRSSVSVLINGQSGTGKELVAKALHKHSPRKDQPFIALNMAAIPQELVESELFGHEKGAFTGAAQARKGRFEQADGGTLFLDEIGDMGADVQSKLLRVLAEGQFYRVGGVEPLNVDVRIIAATHQNLETLVEQDRFREDLFHRLNVIRIRLPNLNERREDIPALTEHFLTVTAKELGIERKSISKAAIDAITHLNWRGNVRQLENMCRWLSVMASGNEILVSDLPPMEHPELDERKLEQTATSTNWQQPLQLWAEQKLKAGDDEIHPNAVKIVEKILLQAALKHCQGHKQEAAKRLGWGRNTLTRKLQDLS